MFNKDYGLILAGAVCVGITGCAASPADEVLGEAEEPAIAANAIAANALAPNAIAANAIAANAIAANALTAGALSPSSLSALQDPGTAGDLSRMFVRYAVGCAFDPTQSFSFSWTDSAGTVHNEQYWGILAIAPYWATGPLDDTGQRLVSACLAARTNYLGVSVLISMRSDSGVLDDSPASEINAYPYLEGAFWGNIFTTTPSLYACVVPADAAHSEAAQRYCATGYPDPTTGAIQSCGIITLAGSCNTLCNKFDASSHAYTGCVQQPAAGTNSAKTSLVITTALP
jgi:hypothetical protein